MNAYPFFEVEKLADQQTAILYLNRPDKLNAMSWPFWRDLPSSWTIWRRTRMSAR